MVQEVYEQLQRQSNNPLQVDDFVVDLVARDAIPASRRYEGMPVYVQSQKRTYYLIDWIWNTNWEEWVISSDVPTLPANIVESVGSWSNINISWTANDPVVNVVSSPSFAWSMQVLWWLQVVGASQLVGVLDKWNNKIINLDNPTNPQDAATKSYVDSQIPSQPIFGTQFQFASDSSVSITTWTTYQTKINLSTNSLPSWSYRIHVCYGWCYDANNTDFIARVLLNWSQLWLEHQQEPRDSWWTWPTGTNQKFYLSRTYSPNNLVWVNKFILNE